MATKENKQTKVKVKNPYIEWFPDADIKKKINEALSVKARRQLAQRMIRMARKLAVAKKKARARFATDKNLKVRAQRLTRSIFRKRVAGKRGQEYGKLGMADRMALDKLIDKQAPAVKKMVGRLMPAVKRAEAQRLAQFRVGSGNESDKRHKKKFQGAKHEKSR